MYRRLLIPITVIAVVLAFFAANSAPASAHSTIVEQGTDYVVTDSGHMSGAVCDWEKDGNRVEALWYNEDGPPIARADVGGVGTCDQETWYVEAEYVVICEYGFGDTPPDPCTESHNL
jgi:hypothetical protein